MSDDLLRPDVPPDDEEKIRDEERRVDVAEPGPQQTLEREGDAPGIGGEEHLGLTPPG